jgi:hypothetical protein
MSTISSQKSPDTSLGIQKVAPMSYDENTEIGFYHNTSLCKQFFAVIHLSISVVLSSKQVRKNSATTRIEWPKEPPNFGELAIHLFDTLDRLSRKILGYYSVACSLA